MEQSKFYQIKNVTELEYTLVCCDGSVITRPIRDIDKTATAFTIQDAKDGDVLCSGQLIILFKQWEVNADCNFVIAHAGVDISGKLQITNGHWLISNKSKPATKEQRDILIKAMADAGYTFDFEKKELKEIGSPVLSSSSKIGKNVPAEWSREDEKNLNAALGYIDDEYLRRWLKDVIHVQYDNKNIEWSEEDKKMIERLILSLSRISANTRTDSTSLSYTFYNEINWLKSLKYRVQPKQEWSEECERNIKELLFLVESNYLNSEEPHDRLIDFLESIKSYTYWKPSEEQIKAVKEASCYSSVLSEKTVDNLISLSKQLKKLREE